MHTRRTSMRSTCVCGSERDTKTHTRMSRCSVVCLATRTKTDTKVEHFMCWGINNFNGVCSKTLHRMQYSSRVAVVVVVRNWTTSDFAFGIAIHNNPIFVLHSWFGCLLTPSKIADENIRIFYFFFWFLLTIAMRYGVVVVFDFVAVVVCYFAAVVLLPGVIRMMWEIGVWNMKWILHTRDTAHTLTHRSHTNRNSLNEFTLIFGFFFFSVALMRFFEIRTDFGDGCRRHTLSSHTSTQSQFNFFFRDSQIVTYSHF